MLSLPALARTPKIINFLSFFPNSWYNYRVLVGYFRESPRRSQNLVPPGAGKMVPGLFLTTVTHFEHFLGPRCRTGAGPELGPSLVPNGPLQGAPRTTQGSPRSGFPAGWLVIRYPASGPGPVFRLAGRLSGIRIPVPLTTTVRVLCWDNCDSVGFVFV